MRSESAPTLVAALVTLLIACAAVNDEPLPSVHQPSIFEAQPACVAPPPPPPFQEPTEKPSDPRACLPKSWANRALPVEIAVVNGVVREVRFYDQCEGRAVQVEASIRECIQSSLGTWRYATGPPCPGHDAKWTEYLSLRRPSADGRQQGCEVELSRKAASGPTTGS